MNIKEDSILVLLNDDQARLTFDPVDAADNPPSTSFNLMFSWSMPFQSCMIEHRECWFVHDELCRFEAKLSELTAASTRKIVLQNMSGVDVLTLTRDGNNVQVRFHASDSSGLGNVVFTVETYALELSSILSRLRSYPKWW